MTTNKNTLNQWAASQSSPWTPVNTALTKIDQLLTISVKSVSLLTPPGGEAEGDAYIPAATSTNDWAGHENELAYFENGGYVFIPLVVGALIYNEADSKYYNWNGTNIGELNIARI